MAENELNGFDRIIRQIADDAEKEAADLTAAAKQECEAALESARADNRIAAKAAQEKAAAEAEDYAKRIESQCGQQKKLLILKTKQELISQVLEKAYEAILQLPAEEYFEDLLRLLPGAVQAGEQGTMLLGAQDLKRMPANFPQKVNQIAAEKQGTITVLDQPADLEGGFLLRYGPIEMNESLRDIFEERREDLTDLVSRELWKEQGA